MTDTFRHNSTNMLLELSILLYSCVEFIGDMSRGLGASNGRYVSFLSSIESAYSYRIQQPIRSKSHQKLSTPRKMRQRRQSMYYAGSNKNAIWSKAYLGFVCGWLKFGTGTFISLVLGVEPTITKNWRHFASFGVALMCIQLTPKDIFFQQISEKSTRGLCFRLCMFTGCAIYKLKKMTFVVHTTRMLGYSWMLAIFLCVVECEGSGILRRAENQCMHVTWTSRGVLSMFISNVIALIERTNFWLSVLVACTLTLGAHLSSGIEGPSVYTIPWSFNAAVLLVLVLRYSRTTLIQLCSNLFPYPSKNNTNDETLIFEKENENKNNSFSLTSTPMRKTKRSKKNGSQKKSNESQKKNAKINSELRKRKKKNK